MKKKVSKDMLIGDIIKDHPGSAEVMMEHGLHCIGCHVATWETLEQGASSYGINVKKLVDSINKNVR